MVINNVHTPTEDKVDDEKEEFYATLEDVYDSSAGYIKIIVGNLNAKVGQELEYRAITGSYSLHKKVNNNDNMLRNFAIGKGLSIKSTMFPRKDIYKYTSVSSTENIEIKSTKLINSGFKNCINIVRTLRGADMDTDHLLMGILNKSKVREDG